MHCYKCGSTRILGEDILDVGLHVICYDCDAEWVE